MTIRHMTVERRVVGTINQAETYAIHYVVRADEDTPAKAADFMVAAVVAAAGGNPSPTVFTNVSAAVRLYGRTLAGTDGTHDEHTEFSDDGAGGYNIMYRDIPPTGESTPPQYYTLAAVKAAPGAPSGADFDAVIAALISFGDAAAGYS